jgi:DNA-binding response OmpR family regulator
MTNQIINIRKQQKINILVIEDEYDLRDAIVSYLRLENLNTHGVGDTQEAKKWLQSNFVDIIILDIGLPDQNGIDWLNETRIVNQCGIIVATARSMFSDKLQAIAAGADAFLIKPIEYNELMLVIHNIYNRINNSRRSYISKEAENTWIITEQWELICPLGQVIELTKSEYILLKCLAEAEDKNAKKASIVNALGYTIESYDYRRMETLIRRLKNKVKSESGMSLPIKTVYAIGYAFTAELTLSAT